MFIFKIILPELYHFLGKIKNSWDLYLSKNPTLIFILCGSVSFWIEKNIIKELKIEKGLIDDPAMTIRFYNYSYIQDQLRRKHKQEVSLPTIIGRAKKGVFTYQDLKRQFMTMR